MKTLDIKIIIEDECAAEEKRQEKAIITLLKYMVWCSDGGHCGTAYLIIDGDGSFHPEITLNGETVSNTDKDEEIFEKAAEEQICHSKPCKNDRVATLCECGTRDIDIFLGE